MPGMYVPAVVLQDTHHTGLDPVSNIRIQAWILEMPQSQRGCSVYPEVSCAGYLMDHPEYLQLLVFWHQVAVSLT